MPSFSQRLGIRPLQKAIQRESMDEELRNRLWSAMKLTIWDKWSPPDHFTRPKSPATVSVERLVLRLWLNYFKRPVDTIPDFRRGPSKSGYAMLREHFFGTAWWDAYEFLEFVIKETRTQGEDYWATALAVLANKFLEEENAAYRVSGDRIVPITNEHEIEAIESALGQSTRAVRDHLDRALALLSDRKQPDYRNAIKESISAVEAACQAISGKAKATLGECLKELKTHAPIHPALEAAFGKLYGYTSDSGGIRHALADDSAPPTYADAKFMLVACSAFTSYLWTKAAENGIDLSKPDGAG